MQLMFYLYIFSGVSDLQNEHPDQVETQARVSESSLGTALEGGGRGWSGGHTAGVCGVLMDGSNKVLQRM